MGPEGYEMQKPSVKKKFILFCKHRLHKMLTAFENKGAYALCKFALICPENPEDVLIFTGKTEGIL
jgi:inosine/xanthosine triphosphate pyrophosphatase family protein